MFFCDILGQVIARMIDLLSSLGTNGLTALASLDVNRFVIQHDCTDFQSSVKIFKINNHKIQIKAKILTVLKGLYKNTIY